MNFRMRHLWAGLAVMTAGTVWLVSENQADENPPAKKVDVVGQALDAISKMKVGNYDWPMWGGTAHRNNTPYGKNIPIEWSVGDYDEETGKWSNQQNIRWVGALGSQSYGNPVVANGKVYVGTNNGAGHIKRYPAPSDNGGVDLGCLVCFNEKDGKFLWQHSSEKLPTGRVHDWPEQGICCSPFIDGERGWFVTSRGEVVCFDPEGFHDGENDGPFKGEVSTAKDEADVIWRFDMMGTLGVSQHNMCSCSITGVGDVIFVCTSNGLDESHINLPAPNAPSFMAMNRDTGKVLWTDKSPGTNILHGQWSSPAYGVLGGQEQVMFAGGDSWLYSFDPKGDGKGNAKLLWKFDCNPKETKWILGGNGTRNELIATPVIYDGLVFIATGQDPEHGEGEGNLWCIDPTKRGDVSPTLAVDKDGKPLAHVRLQAVNAAAGEKAIPNPNSAVIWRYHTHDLNGNNKPGEFEESMHRTIGTVAIKDDILYIADFSGLVHCMNARTGKPYWTYDMFAASWGSPLIVEDKVYIGDEDGDITIFKLGTEQEIIGEINMGSAVYSSPIVANNTLFIANKSFIFAIATEGEEKTE